MAVVLVEGLPPVEGGFGGIVVEMHELTASVWGSQQLLVVVATACSVVARVPGEIPAQEAEEPRSCGLAGQE
jgi:hypothetical protein